MSDEVKGQARQRLDGPGRPRREATPFMEQRGKSGRWRRACPPDLTAALGLVSWTYNFGPDTPPEVLEATAAGLAQRTDALIIEGRARLERLRAAREAREATAIERA